MSDDDMIISWISNAYHTGAKETKKELAEKLKVVYDGLIEDSLNRDIYRERDGMTMLEELIKELGEVTK